MEKYVIPTIFCLLMGMALTVFPLNALASAQEELGLQVLDYPSQKIMITFFEKHAPGAAQTQASMNISGCGDFRLYKLIDYTQGKNKTVSLPWGHRLVDQKEWGTWEKWFRHSMKKRCDKSRRLPRDIPSATWYTLTPQMSAQAAEAESAAEIKQMLDTSKVPGISKYVIEQGQYQWWPPKAPKNCPFDSRNIPEVHLLLAGPPESFEQHSIRV